MRDFYVQLLSNASTDEFPTNKANSFKNRLPYPLVFDDREWKVGLTNITYPTPPLCLHQIPTFKKDELICRIAWTSQGLTHDSFGNVVVIRIRSVMEITGVDLIRERIKVTSGKSLMQYIANELRSRMTLGMGPDGDTLLGDPNSKYKDIAGEKYYPVFRWKGNDLVIDHTDTMLKNVDRDWKRPEVVFGRKLALAMEWVGRGSKDDDYNVTDNHMKEFPGDTVKRSPQLDWKNEDTHKSWSNYWNLTSEGLQLSCFCNWRFTYLDECYQKAYGGNGSTVTPPQSPLYVYSNVGRSMITGNRVTDLLREIPHDPTKMSYEPVHIQ